MKEILKIENVSKNLFGLKALSDVFLEVYEDEIFGLIGPDGAGKTTLFDAVSGSSMPNSGKVYFNGKDMTGKKITDYALEGLARIFQNIRVSSKVTVFENVAVGMYKNVHTNLFSICMNNKKQKEAEKRVSEKAMEILRLLKIERFADETAGNLPYGTQRLVEITRVLASESKLFLLDEPTAGMNQQETTELTMLIQEIRKQGPVVPVIERNMKFMMSLCYRIAVLNFGQLLTLGEPAAVQNNLQVVEAYLGNNEEEQHMALEIKDLVVKYGETPALRGVSFTAEDGELTILVGLNGAGKSTLLKTTSGLLKPAAGGIMLDGREIGGMEADKIVTLGIPQCPEGKKVFQNQTVYEDLKMGAFIRKDNGMEADVENHFSTFSRLREGRNQPAGSLSGGEQQMPVICRALMTRSKLFLLDEPSTGLVPVVVQEVSNTIKGVDAQGTPILPVKQNAKQALRIADYGYVLEIGNMAAPDTAENLLAGKAIQGVYLGGVQAYEK